MIKEIGSIELARTICEELKGELPDGEQYGSVDIAEILSAHVRNLEDQRDHFEALYVGAGGTSTDDKNVRDQRANGGALVDQGLRVAHARMVKAEREATHLRMQIGYIVAELQIAGDKRSTPEIVEAAAKACS